MGREASTVTKFCREVLEVFVDVDIVKFEVFGFSSKRFWWLLVRNSYRRDEAPSMKKEVKRT